MHAALQAVLSTPMPILFFRQHRSTKDIPKYSKHSSTSLAHTHTSTPRSPLCLCRSTSAECRNTCHKRGETLPISEFTSAQAQGSVRSDRPPNSLVIKDKDTEEGMKEGLRKKRREGEKECCYLLSDSPAEMC